MLNYNVFRGTLNGTRVNKSFPKEKKNLESEGIKIFLQEIFLM